MQQSVKIGKEADARRIAVISREGKGPPVVWLGGFKSDMRATKAGAID
ncbi:MAG: alpha/beta hydrolase, partial [Microvirga sp.]